jgi:chromosome segregation ATPase
VAQRFSLNQLAGYVSGKVQRIGAIRAELEEIQVGFNSAYVEWKAEHDATLERLAQTVADRLLEVGPDLQARVERGLDDERRSIAERRDMLRDQHVPEAQAEADEALAEGQRLARELRQENPRLNEREEELKARREALETELNQLNEQIRDLSGCLGVAIHVFRIRKLDRERERVIGKLEAVQWELDETRKEWQKIRRQAEEQQGALQARWRDETLRLAQLQGELAYLDDETSREALARRRATRRALDELKGAVACPLADLGEELDTMVGLNVETDDYHEGLGAVSGFLALLDGVANGLSRFEASVQGMIREQNMHSAHLPSLSVSLPPEVLAFHEQWNDLYDKVHDDGRLCTRPAEFLATVRPIVDGSLSQERIAAMFDSLGQALKRAAAKWRA